MQCQKEVGFQDQLVELLMWMYDHHNHLSEKIHLDHFIVLLWLNNVLFVDHREYKVLQCDFETWWCTNSSLNKIFVGWTNV